MATIPQRIASAFAVLCGQHGDVTRMARDREQSRQSLYREAEQVAQAVDGSAARDRIDELQQQLAQRQAEVQLLQERLKRAVEMTPEKQAEFATVAQAEGVSLSVARRLLQVVEGPGLTPSVPTLGRATLEAGKHAGASLAVLDEAARPKVEQATADEIFSKRPAVGAPGLGSAGPFQRLRGQRPVRELPVPTPVVQLPIAARRLQHGQPHHPRGRP